MWFVRGEFAKSEFFPFWAKFAIGMSSNQKKKGSWEKKTRQGLHFLRWSLEGDRRGRRRRAACDNGPEQGRRAEGSRRRQK